MVLTGNNLDWWCGRGILFLILGMLVFAPLAFGAVEPWALLVVAGAAAAVFILWLARLWLKAAKLTLAEISRSNGVVTIEARVSAQDGVACLDAANTIRFGLAGDGRLLDNLGTSTGSRVVQLYNGRAQISVQLAGRAVASVASDGLPTEFFNLSEAK